MIDSIVGLILTENIEAFDKLYIEIICLCMFIGGLSFLVFTTKDLRRIEIEKNNE